MDHSNGRISRCEAESCCARDDEDGCQLDLLENHREKLDGYLTSNADGFDIAQRDSAVHML